MRKKFKKAYDAKYIILNEDELNSTAYADKNKYRYYFSYYVGTTVQSKIGYSYKKFYVYDRLKEKKYVTGAQFAFYAKAMEAYLENLNELINTKP